MEYPPRRYLLPLQTDWCRSLKTFECEIQSLLFDPTYGSVNLVPLVNIKIAGKWMFIPLKLILIGYDPYPYLKTRGGIKSWCCSAYCEAPWNVDSPSEPPPAEDGWWCNRGFTSASKFQARHGMDHPWHPQLRDMNTGYHWVHIYTLHLIL